MHNNTLYHYGRNQPWHDECDEWHEMFCGLGGTKLLIAIITWIVGLLLMVILFIVPGICLRLQDWWDRKEAEKKHIQDRSDFKAKHCSKCIDVEDCRARNNFVEICMKEGTPAQQRNQDIIQYTAADGICLQCGGPLDMLGGCIINRCELHH